MFLAAEASQNLFGAGAVVALIAAVPGVLAFIRSRQADKDGFAYDQLELLVTQQAARITAVEARLDTCEQEKLELQRLVMTFIQGRPTLGT